MLSEGNFVQAAKGTSWMHEMLVAKMEDGSERRGHARGTQRWPTMYRWIIY